MCKKRRFRRFLSTANRFPCFAYSFASLMPRQFDWCSYISSTHRWSRAIEKIREIYLLALRILPVSPKRVRTRAAPVNNIWGLHITPISLVPCCSYRFVYCSRTCVLRTQYWPKMEIYHRYDIRYKMTNNLNNKIMPSTTVPSKNPMIDTTFDPW
jgi:hypothetical protein